MTDRCPWCGTDPVYVHYHDHEWGVPVRDENKMFEFLLLETFQAGLSWITILKRREGFRQAFSGFDAEKIARYNESDMNRLMNDPGIIRNKQKILAAIKNARQVLDLREKGTGLNGLMWESVGGEPVIHRWTSMKQVPATTHVSDQLSKRMKELGFAFVGSTTLYAHLQAAGLVNDHLITCPRHAEVQGL